MKPSPDTILGNMFAKVTPLKISRNIPVTDKVYISEELGSSEKTFDSVCPENKTSMGSLFGRDGMAYCPELNHDRETS